MNILNICLIDPYHTMPYLIAELGNNLDALFTGIMKPHLNGHFDHLSLFHNVIT